MHTSRWPLVILLTMLLIPWTIPLRALDPDRKLNQHSLEMFTTEDGLPQSSVMSIVQTSDGYIWLGTYEGLARFDGRRFVVFDKTNVPQMENNTIKALYEDSRGCLWVGTPNGLLCQENGDFRKYTMADGLTSNFILSITEDLNGKLWVGTTQGVNRLDEDGFTGYRPSDGLIDEYVSTLAPAENGIWIGTSVGLDLFQDGRFTHYGKRDGLPGVDIRSLYREADGTLWIGTSGDGLVRFNGKQFHTVNGNDDLRTEDVRCILRDRNQTLWIGTNGGGLFALNSDGKFRVLSERDGLLNNSVRSVMEDREGSVWIGTRDGLYQLKDDKFIFLSSRNGLPVDSVRTVFQSSNGNMWIGTVGGGLVRYDGDKIRIFNERDGFSSSYIWSIAEGPQGVLWVGTYGGGLYRIEKSRVTRVQPEGGLSNDIVRAILVDRQGRTWVGTNGGGVDIIQDDRIVQRYNTGNGLSEDYVYSLAEDESGTIWVGTYSGGLNRIENGRITVFGEQAGFTNNGIWVIHPDADDTLWIGTDDAGLFHYRAGNFFRFSIRDGLYNDSTFSIIDDDGTLWFNSNRGIFSVPKDHLLELESGQRERVECLTLGKSEGIKVTESNGPAQPAAFRAADGSLWFSTIKGVAIIHPSQMRVNQVKPNVAIESIRINGKPVNLNRPIRVPRGMGEMEIKYTGLSFLLPEKVMFRYRLEGYNEDWVDAGTRRVAFYTNLPPRAYTFRVIASNNDGIWNETGAKIRFELTPPFTQTPLFYAIVGVLLLVFFLLLYYLRIQQVRRKEKELSALVDERTRQLNNLNRKLEYLARTDGLTDIPNHRFLMEQLETEWRTAFRESKPIALLFVDIDRFKDYNDRYGHQRGDERLRQIAQLLESELKRPRDFVARYGGEEFVAILPDTNHEGAMSIAERLRAEVEQQRPSDDDDQPITISVGVSAAVPVHQDAVNRLIRAADEALYAAKQAGRNRVVYKEPEN